MLLDFQTNADNEKNILFLQVAKEFAVKADNKKKEIWILKNTLLPNKGQNEADLKTL